MCPVLHHHRGYPEAVIDEDGSLKRFYEVANLLSDGFKIRYASKLDDIDSLFWNFRYNGQQLCLHYNIYTGICLYPADSQSAGEKMQATVTELASYLESKLMVHAANKFVS